MSCDGCIGFRGYDPVLVAAALLLLSFFWPSPLLQPCLLARSESRRRFTARAAPIAEMSWGYLREY